MIHLQALAVERGYPRSLQVLHWLSAVLLLGPYVAIWTIGYSGGAYAQFLMVHRSFGLAVLVLTVLRLVWRLFSSVPPLPDAIAAPQRLMARLNVVALYVLLILQPLLGLIGSMISGARIYVFGGYRIPSFFTKNSRLAQEVLNFHGCIAILLLALIGLHVAAALYHHFVRRDDVLVGMLPLLRRRRTAANPLLSERA